jgi:hypothetical protein
MGIFAWVVGLLVLLFLAFGLLAWIIATLDELLMPPAVATDVALAGRPEPWARQLRALLWSVWLLHLLAGAVRALRLAPQSGRDVLRETVERGIPYSISGSKGQ